jgi:hypothetical protein
MPTLKTDYLSAYDNLKLKRDDKGVREMNRGQCTNVGDFIGWPSRT